jgi:O-antigen ligase
MTLGNLSDQQAISGGAIILNRAEASFAHPTALAHFLMLSFPLAFALGLRGPVRWRWLMMASGTLGLAGLMLTQTRGSIIGAAVALTWMMVRWAPFRRLAFAGLGLIAIVAVLNLGSVTKSQPVTVASDRLGTLSLDSTGDDRLHIWRTTPDIVASNPFLGVGQGNFSVVSPSYGLRDIGGLPFDHAHNLFLNVAAECGLLGLALLMIFLIVLAGNARQALSHPDNDLYPLAIAVSASLLALLVNSLTEYPLRQNLIMATIMIDVGLLLGIKRLVHNPSSPDPV